MIENVSYDHPPNPPAPKAPRKPRKPAAKKAKPVQGRKTLYVAAGALAFAAADLLVGLRYPGVPGACQILRDMF